MSHAKVIKKCLNLLFSLNECKIFNQLVLFWFQKWRILHGKISKSMVSFAMSGNMLRWFRNNGLHWLWKCATYRNSWYSSHSTVFAVRMCHHWCHFLPRIFDQFTVGIGKGARAEAKIFRIIKLENTPHGTTHHGQSISRWRKNFLCNIALRYLTATKILIIHYVTKKNETLKKCLKSSDWLKTDCLS